MKTRKGIGLVLVIALLVLANACLDYTAVCKALDVDSLFDGAVTEIVSGSEEGQAMLVSNIIAIVISLGCAAKRASRRWARRRRSRSSSPGCASRPTWPAPCSNRARPRRCSRACSWCW